MLCVMYEANLRGLNVDVLRSRMYIGHVPATRRKGINRSIISQSIKALQRTGFLKAPEGVSCVGRSFVEKQTPLSPLSSPLKIRM